MTSSPIFPDRIFVEVDRRFDVAIERTETGLSLRVYPRTDGELWCDPFAAFEVDEAEVIAIENEMRLLESTCTTPA